jgi:transposase InsO family protein
MQELALGQPVVFEQRRWHIVSYSMGTFGLREIDTGEAARVTLSRLLEENPVHDRISRVAAVLNGSETLSQGKHPVGRQKELMDELGRKLADAYEVAYGKAEDADEYRQGYGPETRMWARAGRKAAELKKLADELERSRPEIAESLRVSQHTLYRRAVALKEEGPSGLLDARKLRNHRVTDGVDERVVQACRKVIDDRMHRSNVSKGQMAAEVKARIIAEYGDDQVVIPRSRTISAIIDELSARRYLHGDARNRRSAASAPERMYGSHPAVTPGWLEFDSTRLDVDVILPDGRKGRPELAILMDPLTRSIVAFTLAMNIRGGDLAFLIAQTMTPRPRHEIPETPKNLFELQRRGLPWAGFFDAEEREAMDVRVPLIRPQGIVTDNGSQYRSVPVQNACRKLGITLVRASPWTPTDKPHVESKFDDLPKMFCEKLPGYTGGSVSRKGEHPEDEDLLTIYELAWLLDRWIVHIWQNTPTEGLRDPRLGAMGAMSPNAAYTVMFSFAGFRAATLSRNDYISLLPYETRKINSYGIQIDYRIYDSAELANLRRRKSGTLLDGLWDVHYNPINPNVVWVHDPETDEYIQCEWKENRMDRPFSAEMFKLGRQIQEGTGVRKVLMNETSRELVDKGMAALKRERKRDQKLKLERSVQDAQKARRPDIQLMRGEEGYRAEPHAKDEPLDVAAVEAELRLSKSYQSDRGALP